MRPDPIVEEVRKVRDALAARFNYDLEAIFRDLREKEKESGRSYVTFQSGSAETDERQSRELGRG
jgi:hypothetical protein